MIVKNNILLTIVKYHICHVKRWFSADKHSKLNHDYVWINVKTACKDKKIFSHMQEKTLNLYKEDGVRLQLVSKNGLYHVLKNRKQIFKSLNQYLAVRRFCSEIHSLLLSTKLNFGTSDDSSSSAERPPVGNVIYV